MNPSLSNCLVKISVNGKPFVIPGLLYLCNRLITKMGKSFLSSDVMLHISKLRRSSGVVVLTVIELEYE